MQPNIPGPMAPMPSQGSPVPPGQPMVPFGENPYANMTPVSPRHSPRHSMHMPWLLISFVVTIVVLLGVVSIAIWAYMRMQDYKTNSDKKVAAAVTVAKQQEDVVKDKEFADKEKYPLKDYRGPATYGSLVVTYPKTWSAFVNETSGSGVPVDGYFHPNFVPGLASGTAFALRVQVTSQPYANELRQFDSAAKSGKVKVSAYQLPRVDGVTGSRVDGEITPGQSGSIVLLPLRDKTIKISTMSPQFVNDFNNIVLPNVTFVP